MDREALRSKAASRRNVLDADSSTAQKVSWDCSYCSKAFLSEKVFMKHRCREKERIDELKSPVGQAAYLYYAEWMRASGRSVPDIERFSHSTFYTTFIKFAQHVQRVHIPNVKVFIKLMVDNGNVSPGLWCRDNVYAMYLNWYDKGHNPETQFLESLDYAKALAAEHQCPVYKVFEAVGWEKLDDLIRRRRLSTWFLLSSKVFRQYIMKLQPEEKEVLDRAMNSGAMIAHIQQHADLFKLFNAATQSEGL